MKDFLLRQIRYLEEKRDRNVKIHCIRTADHIQREINKLKEELKELEDGNKQ